MFRLRSISLLLLQLCLLLILPTIAQAAQPLPASPWYVVLYMPENDMLIWVNQNGQQASIARPKLPNENATPEADVIISPNGQYGIISTKLTNNNVGIGIYNFQTGLFIKTHEAQPNEIVILSDDAFDLASGMVAIGLASTTDSTWRVVIFDIATGNAINQANSPLFNAPQDADWMPIIAYVEGTGTQAKIHLQLLPQAAGPGQFAPAYLWSLGNNTIQTSPYNNLFADIHPLTGAAVFTYVDPNYALVVQDSPLPPQNAIGWQLPTAGQTVGSNPTLIYPNPSFNNFGATWAANGNWVVYGSPLPSGTQWSVTETQQPPNQGVSQPIEIADVFLVFGTSDGYILQTTSYDLFFANNINQPSGQIFFKPLTQTEVIYVTPFGATFTLATLADTQGGQVVNPPPANGASCNGAPPQRLTVGKPARVTFTDGTPLRVRTAPNGSIITQIEEGTVMNVLAGPQCGNNFSWWQIQTNVNGSNINGWVAEGDFEDYYVEPVGGQLSAGATATVAPVISLSLASATPLPISNNPNDCSLAPIQRLSAGITAKVIITNGTLALFTNVEDTIPTSQVPPGVFLNVIEGPKCSKQYRFWRVQFSLNGQLINGWISEGTQQEYFLEPVN